MADRVEMDPWNFAIFLLVTVEDLVGGVKTWNVDMTSIAKLLQKSASLTNKNGFLKSNQELPTFL